MRPPKVYYSGVVKIVKYAIEWADSCPKDLIRATESRVIAALEVDHGAHYHNPEYSVYAPAGSDLEFFIRQARRAQLLWYKRLVRVFGRKAKRRMTREEPPETRRFLCTGVLIVGHQMARSEAWPDVVPPPRSRTNSPT